MNHILGYFPLPVCEYTLGPEHIPIAVYSYTILHIKCFKTGIAIQGLYLNLSLPDGMKQVRRGSQVHLMVR